MDKDSRPVLLSIRCTVYNHERYLRKCLEGFVMQKTNFRFEAIVHDDASTDNSAAIIREFAEKYPDIIKPIYQTENQYSKHNGRVRKAIDAAISPESKYIAICEGDDYWIDSNKLQRQVDFLEDNPDYTYTCHRFRIYNEFENKSYLEPNKYFMEHPDQEWFTFDKEYTFFVEWVSKTLTAVYRRDALDEFFLNQFKYRRDIHLVYNLLSEGKGACFAFIGGVYNKNSSGIYGSLKLSQQWETNYIVYKEFYQKFKAKLAKRKCLEQMFLLMINNEYGFIKDWFDWKMALYHYPVYKIKRKLKCNIK